MWKLLKININKECMMIQGHNLEDIYEKLSNLKIMKNLRLVSIKKGSNYVFYIGGNVRAWLNLMQTAQEEAYFISDKTDIMIMSQFLNIVFKKLGQYRYTKFFFQDQKKLQKLLKPYYDKIGVIFDLEKDSITILDSLDSEIYYIKKFFKRFSFNIICDRGLAYAVIRHREMPCLETDTTNDYLIGYEGDTESNLSVSQESTRWINYLRKQGGDIEFIPPIEIANDEKALNIWRNFCYEAEQKYIELIEYGRKPQVARSVLPNSTKTELVLTGNIDHFKSFLDLRLPANAGPQMNNLALQVYNELNTYL